MGRMIVAALIGLMGATALVTSSFQPWRGDLEPRDTPILDLIPGMDAAPGNVVASMVLPLLAAAGIVVLALVLRSKALMASAGVIGLVTAVLWFVQLDREGAGSTFALADYEPGLWSASAALVLVGVATAVLPRRA